MPVPVLNWSESQAVVVIPLGAVSPLLASLARHLSMPFVQPEQLLVNRSGSEYGGM